MTPYEAIVIGVSAGGLEALSTIMAELPRGFSLPVIVVQHRAESSDAYLATHLAGRCHMLVKEPDDKEWIRAGTVYIAPAGYHLYVEADRSFCLSVDAPVHYARPAIDPLFFSATDVYADRLVGVILTGANTDGAHGLKYMKDHGGLAVIQDPTSAHAPVMPSAAMETVEADHVLPLGEIGPFLARLHMEQGGSAASFQTFP